MLHARGGEDSDTAVGRRRPTALQIDQGDRGERSCNAKTAGTRCEPSFYSTTARPPANQHRRATPRADHALLSSLAGTETVGGTRPDSLVKTRHRSRPWRRRGRSPTATRCLAGGEAA